MMEVTLQTIYHTQLLHCTLLGFILGYVLYRMFKGV